ncbi:Dicarboxylate transport 2 [Klebsormidium nitens]|uniref:Dicarboxylate transport 2 n=1 Tax=Klebsormidium nitens TaxID=105231 RepID=A0A1Y1IS10_KLENI|nr:Dicarboxylate transport 2 [Klebsormidium nitens]|eukprot:GAQ92041.1 Dicarboxylate transport 2 [Klebsormidium nitens]
MASAVQSSLTQRWQTFAPRGSAQTQHLRASSNLACIRAISTPAVSPRKCRSLASAFRGLTSPIPSSLAFNPLRREELIHQKKSVLKRGLVKAAAAAELEAKATPPAWEGAAILPSFISIALGLAVWKAPKPAAISQQAWQLLAIFLSTITGLVLSPLPVGAWAFLGLTVTVLTKTLTFQAAFSAFTNDVIWLIVISFFFARGFVKTGLGDRVATYFVKWLGKSTLGLSYGLTVAEALIAPAMPSTTARAGGVFLPIIKSLSLAGGSKPEDGTQKKLGAYLIQNQFQAAGNSSALFLTAAAQNLLCIKLAGELGVKVPGPWLTWFKVASVPALVALLTGPLILYKIFPPESKNTPEAPGIATKRLEAMGPVTKNEWVMIGTMLLAVTLWIFGEQLGVASVVAAMLGLCVLLVFGVLKWDDCLTEKSAWDTLLWFAVLVGMSGQLNNLGLVKYMSDSVAQTLANARLSWQASFGLLQVVYFTVHYLFASQTAHVGALYSAFLAMNLAAGVPPLLAVLALGYSTNLFGALTHYSSGQAAVYFGAGYTTLPETFKLGFIMAIWNALVWTVVGGVWWKFLGLY